MYDELAIVVGKDTTTCSFSKSYVDIKNEPDNGDNTEFVADNGKEGVVEKEKNAIDRKSTRLNSSHLRRSRMPSSA